MLTHKPLSLEKHVQKQRGLQQRFDLVNQLGEIAAAGASSGIYAGMDTWCRELYTKSITSLEYPTQTDIPPLLGIGRERGSIYIHKTYVIAPSAVH
jgi:hypothetical protein